MQVFPTVPSAYAISVGDRVRTPWSRIRLARFPRQRPGTSPDVRSLRKEGRRHMSAVLTGRRIAILPWTGSRRPSSPSRTVTSYPTLRTDLENAGARWIDAEVHNDNGLVTSRRVDDLPAFTARLVEEFGEGLHLRLVR